MKIHNKGKQISHRNSSKKIKCVFNTSKDIMSKGFMNTRAFPTTTRPAPGTLARLSAAHLIQTPKIWHEGFAYRIPAADRRILRLLNLTPVDHLRVSSLSDSPGSDWSPLRLDVAKKMRAIGVADKFTKLFLLMKQAMVSWGAALSSSSSSSYWTVCRR